MRIPKSWNLAFVKKSEDGNGEIPQKYRVGAGKIFRHIPKSLVGRSKEKMLNALDRIGVVQSWFDMRLA